MRDPVLAAEQGEVETQQQVHLLLPEDLAAVRPAALQLQPAQAHLETRKVAQGVGEPLIAVVPLHLIRRRLLAPERRAVVVVRPQDVERLRGILGDAVPDAPSQLPVVHPDAGAELPSAQLQQYAPSRKIATCAMWDPPCRQKSAPASANGAGARCYPGINRGHRVQTDGVSLHPTPTPRQQPPEGVPTRRGHKTAPRLAPGGCRDRRRWGARLAARSPRAEG